MFTRSIYEVNTSQQSRIWIEACWYSWTRWIFNISSSVLNGYSRLCPGLFNYFIKVIWSCTDNIRQTVGHDRQSPVSTHICFICSTGHTCHICDLAPPVPGWHWTRPFSDLSLVSIMWYQDIFTQEFIK